jgi:DHA1 family inner membrane transport protein
VDGSISTIAGYGLTQQNSGSHSQLTTHHSQLRIDEKSEDMSFKERMIIVILSGLYFTHILDFMIMMPLGNYLMPYFNISSQQFTFLVGAYTLSAGISGFAAAFFVDRYDRKNFLLLGYIGFLLATIACGFAPSYYWLLIARLVAGLFGGLIGAQVLSIVSDMFPYERRGMAMGAIMSSFAVSSTLGVPFALYLANLFSWHAPFLLVGFLGIVIVPLVIKYIPPMSGHIKPAHETLSPWKILSALLQDAHQRMVLVFSAVMIMGHFLIIPFINPFMEFNKGFSKSQTPMIYLVGGAAAFIASNWLGRLSDRHGKLKVFTICVVFSLIVVWVITNLPDLPFAVVLLFFAIWFMLSTGRGVTAQAMISNVVQSEQRGSWMSFNSSVQQLGTSAASFISGAIVITDSNHTIHRFNWLGYFSIGVLFLSLLMARKLFGDMESKKAEPVKVTEIEL